MNNNCEQIQQNLEGQKARRDKKKRPIMKISGRNVKSLQRLIINKKIKNK